MEEKIEKLNKNQRLPRLAVEQTYLRKIEKQGKDAAQEYKSAALKKLDDKLSAIKDKFEGIIKLSPSEKDEASEKAYTLAKAEYDRKLSEFEKHNKEKSEAKYARIEKKVSAQNSRLKAKIDACSQKLNGRKAAAQKQLKDTETILQLEELEMRFGGVKAVDKLSFEVKEGEIFGLIGPNGAGKTTVFNCITQFNKPTGGNIYYRNKNNEVMDLTHQKVHNIIKTGIVRTFQNLELIWELSVLDNMLIGSHVLYSAGFFDHLFHTRKLKREEKIMKARALDVLDRLGLIAYKDVIPFGLPYGILKKIELARTLMVNPRLIILDEPAAGLNEAETEELARTIHKIRNDYECTIFLVEHDMGLVMDICDTVCAISFGKMLAIGTPEEIQTNAVVQEAYLGSAVTEDEDE
ncbi:MAG: ATP-binding cassette domain-containing protein [Clostridia bacterium]|nr:ATP-binding cassette domain-containing protein [Clostridia bacterium]